MRGGLFGPSWVLGPFRKSAPEGKMLLGFLAECLPSGRALELGTCRRGKCCLLGRPLPLFGYFRVDVSSDVEPLQTPEKKSQSTHLFSQENEARRWRCSPASRVDVSTDTEYIVIRFGSGPPRRRNLNGEALGPSDAFRLGFRDCSLSLAVAG